MKSSFCWVVDKEFQKATRGDERRFVFTATGRYGAVAYCGRGTMVLGGGIMGGMGG